MPPSGSQQPLIYVLGEGPGGDEDTSGIQFQGAAGQYLRRVFCEVGIPEDWCAFDNAVRCRPTVVEKGRWGEQIKNRAPDPKEVEICGTYTPGFLRQYQPAVILGLGNIPLSWAWGNKSPGITNVRGLWMPVQGIPYFASFHPSHAMRAEEDDPDSPIGVVFKTDLRRFRESLNSIQPVFALPQPEDGVVAEVDQLATFDAKLEDMFGMERMVSVDLETTTLKPTDPGAAVYSIAVSTGDKTYACVFTSPDDGRKAMQILARCLASKDSWVAHNAQFELGWLSCFCPDYAATLRKNFLCTMLMVRVLHHRKETMGLDNATRIELGVDVKSLTRVNADKILTYAPHEVSVYNAYDAKYGYFLLERLLPQIQAASEADRTEIERLHRCVPALVWMELQGLTLDRSQLDVLDSEFSAVLQRYNEAAGAIPEVRSVSALGVVSLSANRFIAQVLEEGYKIKLPRTASGKQSATDEATLAPLARDGNAFAALVLSYRRTSKQYSTYVTPLKLMTNGRVHPGVSSTLTDTGRFSSQNPNIQNFPKRRDVRVRSSIVSSPGTVFVGADYKALEALVIACLSKDPRLCHELINGIDTHSRWAKEVLKRYPKYQDHCLREADIIGEISEKEAFVTVRGQIKNEFVFAEFYGSVASACAGRMEVPEEIVAEVEKIFWHDYIKVKQKLEVDLAAYRQTGQARLATGRIRQGPLSINQITNTLVQGVAADIVRDAFCRLYELSVETGIADIAPRVHIHDELIFEVREELVEDVIELATQEMVKPSFDFISVPLTVKVTVGTRWSDMEEAGAVTGKVYGQ